MKVYKIRDKVTGEWVSPNRKPKKLWSAIGHVKSAISFTRRGWNYKRDLSNAEIVEFDCVEVGTHEIIQVD